MFFDLESYFYTLG